VQDAFLESNVSDDGLTRAFTHMSIRCNPGAPKGVPEEVMDSFYVADPDIVDLERQSQELRAEIKRQYRFIKRAPKKKGKEYSDLEGKLRNAKRDLKREMDNACRKDYFFRIHNEMMKRQLDREQHLPTVERDVKDVEPGIEYQLEERKRLQEVLCDLSKDLSPHEVVARKILAINLMIALASRQELQTHQPRSTRAPQPALKQVTPEPPLQLKEFPTLCEKTQCIFCLGNKQLSYEQRTFRFSRVSHMMDHVERVHLKHQSVTEKVVCNHPVCTS